jgi:hypothetical protein
MLGSNPGLLRLWHWLSLASFYLLAEVGILSFVPHIGAVTVGIAVGTRSGHPENKYEVKKTTHFFVVVRISF